jgi:uncharacterized protein (TIGR01370 family)
MLEIRGGRGSGRALVLALLSALIAFLSCTRSTERSGAGAPGLTGVERWWILIGHAQALDLIDWRQVARDTQMVVLSGDPRIPLKSLPASTIRLGYLSVGEADSRSDYWAKIRDKSFLVEPDPEWPDNVRVDMRDHAWQDLLLTEEAPRLLRLGFQGFMLDTLDTAPYLERRDPARFAGSRQALRDLLRLFRQAFPKTIVIANGGESLPDAAPFVDGFVVEGVFATYDPVRHRYRPTTADEQAWKLAEIAKARAIATHPVFTIEYADIGDLSLARWAAGESVRHGFRPYVGVRELNGVP